MIAEALKRAGLTEGEQAKITGTLILNPTLGDFLAKMNANKQISEENKSKIVVALAEKWKADNSIIGKLDDDLGSKDLRKKLEAATIASPEAVINKTIKGYNGSNLASVIPVAAEEKKLEPIKLAVKEKKEDKPSDKPAAAKVVEVAHRAHSPEVAKPHKEAGIQNDSKVQEVVPVSNTVSAEDKKLFKNAFESLADEKDDAKVSKAVGGQLVSSVADSLADDAVSKYGVDAGLAEGFKKKINDPDHPELKEAIVKNWKNNPDFVRELALASKNGTEPPQRVKDAAKQAMIDVMENPHKLADNENVDKLAQQMAMARKVSDGPLGMLGGLFGKGGMDGFLNQMMSMFSKLGEQLKTLFGGFSGKPVLSMSSSGNSLFPNVMVNVKNFNDNMSNAQALARIVPERDMKAFPVLGADGKMTHLVAAKDSKGEPIVGDNGKAVMREVLNTKEITDSQGHKHNIIPSIGQVVANQQKDGTFNVVMVDNLDKDGRASQIKSVNLNAQQFASYKAEVEKLAGGREYLVNNSYAGLKDQPVVVASVDQKSGHVSEPREIVPTIGNDAGAVTTPLQKQDSIVGRPIGQSASNDPEYNLRVNS